MEVIFGAPINETKSNSAFAESEDIIGTSNVQFKMESKKRGVYVEKWASPKQTRVEDNKRQPRMKAKPRLEATQKLLTSTPEESKIAAFTRLLGTADPEVRFKKRKTHKMTPSTPKISKQNSKMSNATAIIQPKDIKPVRNIVEENKKNVKKTKYRSRALRQVYSNMSEKTISYKSHRDIVQTPSNSSRVTQDISDNARWSNIFPSDRQNTASKNLLQQYICNYEQAGNSGNTLNDEPSADKKPATPQGKKQEPVYDFFIDLLESVYDEELLDTDEGTVDGSPETSNAKFVVDDNVAEKLYMLQQNPNRYTIKDEMYEASKQKQQLSDYYNNDKRMVPQKRPRRRKTINKGFPYLPPCAKGNERKRRKKPNLLTILKQQLSMDYKQEEPDNMYEALLTIAKQNRKRRQIYIDATSKEPSEPDGVCRFRRRNVISPSTRLPTKKNLPAKDYSINATREKYRSDTTTNDKDSNHSLEVLGFDFDYEEGAILDMESDYSDAAGKSFRSIKKLNEGITTVTQYWKR